MTNKKASAISIPIKFGKSTCNAEFYIYYSNGGIVCLSMWIGGERQDPDTTKDYFRTNEKAIKKEFFRLYGEIA